MIAGVHYRNPQEQIVVAVVLVRMKSSRFQHIALQYQVEPHEILTARS